MQSSSDCGTSSSECECSHVCSSSSKMSKAATTRATLTARLARETEQRFRRQPIPPPLGFAQASVWLPLSTNKRLVTEQSPAAQSRGWLLAAAATSMECNRLSGKGRGTAYPTVAHAHQAAHTRGRPRLERCCGSSWPHQHCFHLRTRIRKESICSSCFLIALMQTKGMQEWSRMKISVSSASPEWSLTSVRLRQKVASLLGTSCARRPTWSFPLRSVPPRPLYLKILGLSCNSSPMPRSNVATTCPAIRWSRSATERGGLQRVRCSGSSPRVWCSVAGVHAGVVQRGGCGAARSVQRRAGAVRRFITSLTRASDTTVQAEEPLALSVSPATYN